MSELQKYFKCVNNIANNTMVYDYSNKQTFNFVKRVTTQLNYKRTYRYIFTLPEIHEQIDKHYFISNITIHNADINMFKCLEFEMDGLCVDKIFPGSINISKIYKQLNSDNSIQIPFCGTFNDDPLYINHKFTCRIHFEMSGQHSCIDSVHKCTNGEFVNFQISYDVYEGSKPIENIRRLGFRHDFNGAEGSGGNVKYLKWKLNHSHPILGFNIVCYHDNRTGSGSYNGMFKVENLLNFVSSITFRFCKDGTTQEIYVSNDLLKELNESYGNGIVPFVPKESTGVNIFQHAIDLRNFDHCVMSFEFVNDKHYIFTEVYALHTVSINHTKNLVCSQFDYYTNELSIRS